MFSNKEFFVNPVPRQIHLEMQLLHKIPIAVCILQRFRFLHMNLPIQLVDAFFKSVEMFEKLVKMSVIQGKITKKLVDLLDLSQHQVLIMQIRIVSTQRLCLQVFTRVIGGPVPVLLVGNHDASRGV
jgi:hypothetical protein